MKGILVSFLPSFSNFFAAAFTDTEDANKLRRAREERKQWSQISKPKTDDYQPNEINNTDKFFKPNKCEMKHKKFHSGIELRLLIRFSLTITIILNSPNMAEEARWQLYKNAASNIEQVLAAIPHKAPTIRPPASHHKNYTS